jgi:crotonobetaine/carnitine-CoA ligase
MGVNGLAGRLAEGGVRAGDFIAVVLPNGPEFLYLWMALAQLRAVLVAVNPAMPYPEMEPLLRQVGVSGVVSDAETLEIYGQHMDLRLKMVVGDAAEADAKAGGAPGTIPFATPRVAESPYRSAVGSDVSVILQTSGTTGRAKGAALTQVSYCLPAREFGRWMKATPEDRFLGCLPLFHMAGQAFAAAAIANGASLALVRKFSGHEFWSQVRAQNITLVRHLGEMLAVLLHYPPDDGDRQHALRAVYGGGAPAAVARAFEARFGTLVVEGYGLSETNTVLCNHIDDRRHGSLGRPLPYCEVRIADPRPGAGPSGRRIGEIQVKRNPVLMAGYAGDPELSRACFDGDWFRTGDLGSSDEEGYFYFEGREKDVIRRRGENILPAHIEETLNRYPAVALAAVVGVPDEVGGEEVKAFLLSRPGQTIDVPHLVEWCRDWLADFQIPRYFELCPDLPRTSTHKINRGELRKVGTLGGEGFDRRTWTTDGV